MRNNLYKRYPKPHQITDLGVGDLVWAVEYSKHPNIGKYQVKRIRNSRDNDFFLYELELVEDYSIEGPGWRRYSCWWWKENNFQVTLSRYPEGAKIVCTKKWKRIRFFSDETVMKHSVRSYIARQKRNQVGRIKRLQRNIDYLEKFERKII